MERLVRVSDTKLIRGGFRVFLDLPDLLPALEPEARAWTWSVQRMPEDLSLVDDSDFDGLADLDDRIHRDPHGLVMDHDQMYWFSRQVVQVVWGEFVAAGSPDALPGPNNTNELVGEHALAGLFAFDSSYWFIGGPAPVIERVAAWSEQVEHLDPRRWIRDAR
jgi:hypothetical protein